MRVMLSGYGAAKQYNTLRAEFTTDANNVRMDESGVRMGAENTPGLYFSGRTIKVGAWSSDNEVQLLFHGIDEAEALRMAAHFVRYACFLRDLPKENEPSRLGIRRMRTAAGVLVRTLANWVSH